MPRRTAHDLHSQTHPPQWQQTSLFLPLSLSPSPAPPPHTSRLSLLLLTPPTSSLCRVPSRTGAIVGILLIILLIPAILGVWVVSCLTCEAALPQ